MGSRGWWWLAAVGCTGEGKPEPHDTEVDADADADADTDTDTDGPVAGPVRAEVCPSPWAAAESWSAVAESSGNLSRFPVIGRLADRDGDGAITLADPPSVMLSDDHLALAVPGDGGVGEDSRLERPDNDLRFLPGGLLVDVNADGAVEVVVNVHEVGVGNSVAAYTPDGALVWESPRVFSDLVYVDQGELTAADLDLDGVPEIIGRQFVVDGATGALEVEFPLPAAMFGDEPIDAVDPRSTPQVADLDLDGVPEIVLAGSVFEADGTERWSSGLYSPDVLDARATHAVVVQADADPEAEVEFLSDGDLYTYDTDGTLLSGPNPVANGETFRPCAADFDGDGAIELGMVWTNKVGVYELDGTPVWLARADSRESCTAFDFDGDGDAEMMIGEEVDVDPVYVLQGRVLDGRTGRERMVLPLGDTKGFFAGNAGNPVAADVNGDGTAEVVVTVNRFGDVAEQRLVVFGPAAGGWADAPASWNGADHGGRIDALGQVGSADQWPYGSLAQRALSAPASTLEAPQLRATLVQVDAEDCAPASQETVWVQVSNTGTASAPAGATLVVTGANGGSASVSVPEVPALAAVVVDVPLTVEAVGGAVTLRVEARFDQCDPVVDETTVADPACP